MPEKKELIVDPNRLLDAFSPDTGYYVRAKMPTGLYETVDISMLTRESLTDWLSKYGDMNPNHINIIGQMLGHGDLMP